MRSSVGSVNPPRLVFDNPKEGERWLSAMSARLARFVPDEGSGAGCWSISIRKQPVGLDTQIVLGLIEVESAFRQYAISGVGARGLMQVMPFWKTTSANRRTTCSISVPTCVTAAPSCAITETLKRATSSAHLPASTAASAAINIRTPFWARGATAGSGVDFEPVPQPKYGESCIIRKSVHWKFRRHCNC